MPKTPSDSTGCRFGGTHPSRSYPRHAALAPLPYPRGLTRPGESSSTLLAAVWARLGCTWVDNPQGIDMSCLPGSVRADFADIGSPLPSFPRHAALALSRSRFDHPGLSLPARTADRCRARVPGAPARSGAARSAIAAHPDLIRRRADASSRHIRAGSGPRSACRKSRNGPIRPATGRSRAAVQAAARSVAPVSGLAAPRSAADRPDRVRQAP